jgi:hypothetical protein
MLKKRCMKPACRNMYVTSVHGRLNTATGTSASTSYAFGDISVSRKNAMFATIS